ncbi:MAG: hypothetical protein DMG40_03710 [Acidobacteria bacterium]|nr:MAG: hypothetical protein DMG40_03710 [Acidobacteriota bacterium]
MVFDPGKGAVQKLKRFRNRGADRIPPVHVQDKVCCLNDASTEQARRLKQTEWPHLIALWLLS